MGGGLVSPAPQCLDELGQQGGDEDSAERDRMSVQLTSEGKLKVRLQVRDPRHSVGPKIMWDRRFSE